MLVTGYLSKSFRYSSRHLWALVTTMVIPYIVFSWLMIHWRELLDQVPPDLEWFLNPRWPMWYLAAVVMWRLATPVLRWHPVMVPVSVVISLLAGLSNHETFDINRALGFLPFFVIGLHLKPEHLAAAPAPRGLGGSASSACCSSGGWPAAPTTSGRTQFLYFRAPYAELGVGDAEGIWIRARLIVVALIGIRGGVHAGPAPAQLPHPDGRVEPGRLPLPRLRGEVPRVPRLRGLDARHQLVVDHHHRRRRHRPRPVLAWDPIARTLNYVVDPVNSIGKRVRSRRRPRDSSTV